MLQVRVAGKRLSQINLNALRVAESVARHTNFSLAAEESCITPSAVSQQIAKLESQLEFKIFDRRKTPVALTAEGEKFILSVRQAFDQILATHNQLFMKQETTDLKISLLPTFAMRWLLPRLNGFQHQHPEFQVHLSQSYQAVNFKREDFDLAIRYGAGDFKDLTAHLLFKEDLIPVCTPELLETILGHKKRSDLNPEDLKHFTLLHSSTCTLNWKTWLKHAGADGVLQESQDMYFDTCMLSFEAANAGLGFAVANRAYIAKDIAAGRLVAPFDLCLPNENGWYLVYPEDHGPHPRVQAFQNWIMDEVAKAPLTEIRKETTLAR